MSNTYPWLKHDILGKWGEDFALQYLLNIGYILKCRNFRFNRMEIDLIMINNKTLVMIEVKTRQSALLGEPWKAVNITKQRQIIRVANYYTKVLQWPHEVRFDIISIVHNQEKTDLQHIQNAFSPLP
jgi:putative endonuclease